MKKFFAAAMIVVLTAGFTGCESKTVQEADAGTEVQTEVQTEIQTETQTEEEQPDNVQAFSNIELEISEGTLNIFYGDSFSLTRHGNEITDYEINDGTLYFKTDRSEDAALTLPKEETYESFALTVKNGHVYAADGIVADELNLELQRGEVKMEELSVKESCRIDIRQGSAFLKGDLGEEVAADCREGNLSMELTADQEDYNYEISSTEGNVRLGSENFHGRSISKTLDNQADRTMEIDCSRGELSIQFR